MATHSSILAWRIPWTEKPGGLQAMGSQRVRRDQVTDTHTHRGIRNVPSSVGRQKTCTIINSGPGKTNNMLFS